MREEIELIAAERERQINEEGWTPEHDLKNHSTGELAVAAAAYAVNKLPAHKAEIPFPWDYRWDKREKHDRLRSLVVAGSLIAAEIKRELTIRQEAKEKAEAESHPAGPEESHAL